MAESNALLAQQFCRDDQQAFAKLVGRHQSLVFRVCLRMLGHRQDAEDATQETFSRVARHLHRWDSRRPFEPWLVAIAGNRCRSLLAKRRSARQLPLTVEPAIDSQHASQAAECLREELKLALQQIPDEHRRAFELFHEHSLNYIEIAERLGCPVGTVKTWVHRARRSVIDQLQQREVIETVSIQGNPRRATEMKGVS